jgi:acyl-coenzyme A thioesterase PaaI-like protein
MTELSLQQKYSPHGKCFGCGPANEKGLRINSFESGDHVTATFIPEKFHEAFPGVLNGGIIGALLDCHSNWTAANHLMKLNKEKVPPCTVTAEYSIKLLRPTPSGQSLELNATVTSSLSDRASIEAKLISGGKVCATCTGLFVAVKEGHPAFHRW